LGSFLEIPVKENTKKYILGLLIDGWMNGWIDGWIHIGLIETG
jgi:hypothetical protein